MICRAIVKPLAPDHGFTGKFPLPF